MIKTPLTYYGGKQNLADIIITLFPSHTLYCESFAGGAAVFFAKQPSKIEILNDKNVEVINFYRVLKTDFPLLEKEVLATLHSRKLHRHAKVIYENPELFDPIKRAWAVWVVSNMSFGSILGNGWGHDVLGKRVNAINHKKQNFTKHLSDRLQNVYIECRDALELIKDKDNHDSFFYIDPPYVGADQGHYAGYTQKKFDALLYILACLKGKFLLSSYPNKGLDAFLSRHNWYQIKIDMRNPMSTPKSGNPMIKTEVLTANYPISKNMQKGLFD